MAFIHICKMGILIIALPLLAYENKMIVYVSCQHLLWESLLMLTDICSFLSFLGTLLDYTSQPPLWLGVTMD